ncbi:MAG: 3,4-dehydroadipyl-CoA semialdehyde dehydrogenase [Planctomycetota bacterium]
MKTLESYVLGSWTAGTTAGATLVNPATEEPLATASTAGIDMAAVVHHAREVGGPPLRALGFRERARRLKALSKAIHEHREELLDISTANAGTTRGDAKFDVDGCTGTLAAYAHWGESLEEGDVLADGPGEQLGRTSRFWGQHLLVPKEGVAVHINAFNFPAWNMGEKMACALLAGMPVIEKPGTPTAMLAWRIAQIVVASELFPEGSFQVLAGSAGDLLDHMGAQDCLAFTGSSKTGAKLRGHPNLVRNNVHVNIEADSLNAAVLGADVAVDAETFGLFLENVARDMTQKTGQKCTAVRRIFVPADRVTEVRDELVARLGRIQVGDPASRETNMGPLASEQQLHDVRAGIERFTRDAAVATGGNAPVHDKGYYVAPTLMVANDAEADCFHEFEVFGPCATILPYSGEAAEAVRLVNLGGGGLVASLYSNDRDWTNAVFRGIAPWHGRVWVASDRVAEQTLPPGTVLPASIHGGPGRAGGGAELGGLRGLEPYLQRVALQGFQGWIEKSFPSGA